MTVQRPLPPTAAVAAALADARRAFISVALFSAVVNLLMLTGPLYMLQVYDRVLPSRSVPTLLALSAFLVVAYAFQGMLDLVRARLVVRTAALLDHHLGGEVHEAVVRLSIAKRDGGDAHSPIRDLDQVRAFLTSSGPIAIVDLPWLPVFLLVCYLIHPWIGVVATIGALVLFVTTLVTERTARGPVRAAALETSARQAVIEATRRNSKSATAMGMSRALAKRWSATNGRYQRAIQSATDVVTTHTTSTRTFRLLLQSILLGVGAYLVVQNELMPGAMIAASVMMSRAMAPLETAIANWRGFVGARDSAHRLSALLKRLNMSASVTQLPPPAKNLEVGHISLAPAGADKPVLNNIHFSLNAGDALGIIGPSGSGKTSLLRVLVGIWPPLRGTVRLDGATYDQWERDQIGRHIGYMAQTAELFDGSIAENIARMDATPDNAAVLRAAEAAGLHDLIVRLPSGYDTPIGDDGHKLSAGQRQRVALARALYGDPFLVALDEPNANLDSEGEAALEQAVQSVKQRGGIVIVVAHRPTALAGCDQVLVVGNGTQLALGPRDDILNKVVRRAAARPARAPDLRVVAEQSGSEA